MKFSYRKRRNKSYPIIPITLNHQDKMLYTEALVDSGANISLFQGSVAEYLGIRVEKGEKIEMIGIGGRIIAYIHRVKLTVNSINFSCKIAFSWELPIKVNILGRDNFFKKFFVRFDETKQELFLEKRN